MAAVTEPTKVIVSRNLRLRRKQLGMSQEFAASELEMRRPHLSDYERGKHEPGDEKLDAFARVLKCERWWLTTPHPEEWRAWGID
jgi:transcriptional regulator with XRE-family HTH domain